MDFLECVLRTAEAEAEIEKFQANGIDAEVLPSLTEDDLVTIGIDKTCSVKILDKTCTLQIPTEKKVDTTMTGDYMTVVLSHISNQLRHICGSISSTLKRKDVVVPCNIELGSASLCLLDCIHRLEVHLNQLEKKVK